MKNKLIKNNEILILIISAFIITIISNLNVDWSLKLTILPSIIFLISYTTILKKYFTFTKKSLFTLIPIILILTGSLTIKIDISNKIINIFLLPLLLTLFFFLYINKKFKITSTSFQWFFKVFPINIFGNLVYLKPEKKNEKNEKVKNIILGSIIGIPIALVILALLTSADAYFSSLINTVTKNIHLNIKMNNILVFLISFILLFSCFINIIKNKNTKLENSKIHNPNNIILQTILYLINIVFTLFLVSEVSKLTNNFLQLPIEYTYASYAREGFFQLLFITIINFSIITFILYKTKSLQNNKRLKKLVIILIGFSILLIFNSYYRMFLYIGHYGLTILRTQVILFLAMEFIIFFILIKRVLTSIKENDFLIYYLITITTYIINLYICNDTIISLIMK